MELFKEQKKNRRKKSSIESPNGKAEGEHESTDGDGNGGDAVAAEGKGRDYEYAMDGISHTTVESVGNRNDDGGEGGFVGSRKDHVGDEERLAIALPAPVPVPVPVTKASKSKKKKKKNRKALSRQSSVDEEGGGNDIAATAKKVVTAPPATAPPPPGLGLNGTITKPMDIHQQTPLNGSTHTAANVADSNLPLDNHNHVPVVLQEPTKDASTSPLKQTQQQHDPTPTQPAPPNNQLPNNLYPPPITRSIVIPHRDRPIVSLTDTKPASLAVSAAKAFVDLYYPHISHGLSSELSMYYTHSAQKSISIGGAHSVVACKADITLQLSSLAGSAFLCRGVVAQDLFEGRGAHVLITGVVQTPLSEVATPFAHSVSLVPTTTTRVVSIGGTREEGPLQQSIMVPYSFQIHNDALSLLTAGDMVALAQQPQPPAEIPVSQPQTVQRSTTSAATVAPSRHEPMTHATDPFASPLNSNHRQPPGLFG